VQPAAAGVLYQGKSGRHPADCKRRRDRSRPERGDLADAFRRSAHFKALDRAPCTNRKQP
ncbi:hypothetical protein LTR56_027254, partial [Elasticomyces elasticus]